MGTSPVKLTRITLTRFQHRKKNMKSYVCVVVVLLSVAKSAVSLSAGGFTDAECLIKGEVGQHNPGGVCMGDDLGINECIMKCVEESDADPPNTCYFVDYNRSDSPYNSCRCWLHFDFPIDLGYPANYDTWNAATMPNDNVAQYTNICTLP